MTEKQNNPEVQQVEHTKGNPPKYKNALDRISRRDRRAEYRTKYNNDRTPKNAGFIIMGIGKNYAVVHFPKRHKIKGWQRKDKRLKIKVKR